VLAVHRDAETVPSLLKSIAADPELRRLDFGVFALHAMLTASFLRVPALIRSSLHIDDHHQWIVYLPVLLFSVAVLVPAIIIAEKYRRMKAVFVASVAALALSQCLFLAGTGAFWVISAVTLFFAGFNVMEASLPSLITKTAPPAAKGTAAGIFSTSQFLGIFAGGVVGGSIQQMLGGNAVFVASLDHETAELPDCPSDPDRGRSIVRPRDTRRGLAAGARRRRGRRGVRGAAGLPQGRLANLRRRFGGGRSGCSLAGTIGRGAPRPFIFVILRKGSSHPDRVY
jgi:hypothetical protein